MIIIVTGITSFLGSHTAAKLIEMGHQVVGIVRSGSSKRQVLEKLCSEAKIITLDLENLTEDSISQSPINEIRADVCIHFAWDGPGSAARMDHTVQYKNIRISQNLFSLCRKIGCRRFVFAGSQAEYGRGEKVHPKPVSEYGKAKLAFGCWAQQAAQEKPEMEFIHLRIYSVYGEGDHPTSLVQTLIQACIEGKTLKMSSCRQKWNYMEIRDCAAAIAMLSTKKEALPGIYDIGSEEIRPLKEYVSEIGEICGGEHCYLLGARPDNAEGAADLIPDIQKLQELGFRSKISFREGIRELYQHMKREK